MKRKKTNPKNKKLSRTAVEQYRRTKISSVVRKLIAQPDSQGEVSPRKHVSNTRQVLSRIREKIERLRK